MTEIFATVGPSTLNKKFLTAINKRKVNLLRINLSHTKIKDLESTVNFIKRYTKIPVCFDTEGAQIRTTSIFKNKMILKTNTSVFIHKNKQSKKSFSLTPIEAFDLINEGDILSIDFDSVQIKIIEKKNLSLKATVINGGSIAINKGVSVNRQIKLASFTKKDIQAFKIAKDLKIKNIALSFASTGQDVKRLREIFKYPINIISKIESKRGLKNLKNIISESNGILIDRGDLSREVPLENIPQTQKNIINVAKKMKKSVYVATNLLESMVIKKDPTRAEVNDIYNTLIDGANGLVLAAETAIGNYPLECINMISKVAKVYKKNHK
tara:strand:+ start:5958 stop:6932 length:975 start_codon:yes stop_codon:yes gene_type:complete